jgi:hypothetical protein
VAGDPAQDQHTSTRPFDGPAVERLILRLPERYTAVRLLGAGGQGMVWLADDRELGEQVAIKVLTRLDPVAAERVRREVRLCRRLRHPNLAEIYELIEAGDHLAVVMQHLPGGSLAERLRDGPLPAGEVVRTSRQLLAGLAHLHAAGIVHRDVKPSNVLLAADGTARLADFGLLRPVERGDTVTRTGLMVGTPAYMSPEQIRGGEQTPASDLYSLGVTVYELAVGRQPFLGASSLEVAHLHLSRHPDSVRAHTGDCPRWLAAFVDRLLAKDPKRRWPDGATALAAFDRRRPGFSRRTRRAAAAAVAAAAAITAVGLVAVGIAARAGMTVAVDGATVVARSTAGRALWHRTLDVTGVSAAVGNVLPAPGSEVVTVEVTRRPGGLSTTELAVRDRRGEVVKRDRAVQHLVATRYEDFSDSFTANIGARLADVDGDGLDDVLLPLAHLPFYPAAVVFWRPAGDRPSKPLLVNSGHVSDLRVADLDGDGRPELVVTGYNNVLGFQSFAAVVSLLGRAFDDIASSPGSPDLALLASSGAGDRDPPRAYTLLGEARGTPAIEAADRSGIRVRSGETTFRLDVDGNPEGSRLWGRGGDERQAFWIDCRDTQFQLTRSASIAGELVDRFAARHPVLWDELAGRDAAVILFARALGDAGYPAIGADVLERADRGPVTNRRVWRQRSELLLLAGRRAEAAALLDAAIAGADRGALPLDELSVLALAAAANGNREVFDRAERLWLTVHGAVAETLVSLEPIRAFFEGRWSAAHPSGVAWADAYAHWQVLLEWALVEDGAPAAAVLETLAPAAGLPEARPLGVLVRARTLMRAGDPRAAADLALQAVLDLETRSRRSYEAFLWQGLAHWVRGAALNEAGNQAAARADLEVAAQRLPATWFGRDARARLDAGRPRQR